MRRRALAVEQERGDALDPSTQRVVVDRSLLEQCRELDDVDARGSAPDGLAPRHGTVDDQPDRPEQLCGTRSHGRTEYRALDIGSRSCIIRCGAAPPGSRGPEAHPTP
ncbi:MAG: hypothetical protein A2X23_04725 [Chloroflexi bacterium GWC2_73_18]|nr:MAG: hypothetical protein A2X23_04725 [Chloroflexi bacterium GWC2_73_18]